MCGINGLIKFNKNLTKKQKALFKEILKNTELRGGHATGVFMPNMVCKIDKPARNFVRTKLYKQIMEKNTKLLMGHNRLTTIGHESINSNNHPFMTDRFAFAHNGTFNNYSEVKRNQELENNGIETDSYVFLQLIDKYVKKMNLSVDKAISNACEEIDGSLACWLWDKDKKQIYLFRRSTYNTSPLSIVWFKNMLVFCSDIDYIKEAILSEYGNANIIHYRLKEREMIRIDMATQKIKTFELPISKNPFGYCEFWDDESNHYKFDTETEESKQETISLICAYGLAHVDTVKKSYIFEITDRATAEALKSVGWCIKTNEYGDYFMRVKNRNLNNLLDDLFELFGQEDDLLDRYGVPINDQYFRDIEPPEEENDFSDIPKKALK